MMEKYQILVKLGPQLRVAFQDHLDALSETLFAAGLISEDNAAEVKNLNQPAPWRASRMLDLVRNRVKLNGENYYRFVGALRKAPNQYNDILQTRECIANALVNGYSGPTIPLPAGGQRKF